MQKVRQDKRRPNKIGEQVMLSGLAECKACGTKHYLCRCGSWNEEQYTCTCGRYHKHKDECTPHTIKVMARHTEQFLQRAIDKHQNQLKQELSTKTREQKKAQKHLADLDKLFRKAKSWGSLSKRLWCMSLPRVGRRKTTPNRLMYTSTL